MRWSATPGAYESERWSVIGGRLPPPPAGEGWGEGCLRTGIVENCGDCPRMVRTLTRRARDDASHRPGRVGLSRKRERREQAPLPPRLTRQPST